MALTDNITGYWKLDESSGNASDSVGSITLTNTGTATYGAAVINNGVTTSSTGPKYLINASACPLTYAQMQAGFSVSWWAKRTGTGADQAYWILYNSNGSNRCPITTYWATATSRMAVAIPISSGSGTTLYWTISDDTTNWFHYVLTYNGTSTWTLYKNGSSLGTNTQALSGYTGSATAETCIGNNHGANMYFNGTHDEVGVWSRELTSTEASNLYNSGSGLQYPFITTSIKTINGLAYASVKTVNGLAVASVKTKNGLE